DSQAEALQFHLKHITCLSRLQTLDLFSHADDDTIKMMLDQAASFADEALAPLAASGDVEGCKLVDGRVTLPNGTAQVYADWCELGFPALALPAEHEGLGFPGVVQSAVQELCDGANLAFGMMAINL